MVGPPIGMAPPPPLLSPPPPVLMASVPHWIESDLQRERDIEDHRRQTEIAAERRAWKNEAERVVNYAVEDAQDDLARSKATIDEQQRQIHDMHKRHQESVLAEQRMQSDLRERLRQKDLEVAAERAKQGDTNQIVSNADFQDEHYSSLIEESIDEIDRLRRRLADYEASPPVILESSDGSKDPWKNQRLASMIAEEEKTFKAQLAEKDVRIEELESKVIEFSKVDPMQGVEALRKEAARDNQRLQTMVEQLQHELELALEESPQKRRGEDSPRVSKDEANTEGENPQSLVDKHKKYKEQNQDRYEALRKEQEETQQKLVDSNAKTRELEALNDTKEHELTVLETELVKEREDAARARMEAEESMNMMENLQEERDLAVQMAQKEAADARQEKIELAIEFENKSAQLKSKYSSLAPPRRRETANKDVEDEVKGLKGEVSELERRNTALQSHIKLLTSNLAKQEKELRTEQQKKAKPPKDEKYAAMEVELEAMGDAMEEAMLEREHHAEEIKGLKEKFNREREENKKRDEAEAVEMEQQMEHYEKALKDARQEIAKLTNDLEAARKRTLAIQNDSAEKLHKLEHDSMVTLEKEKAVEDDALSALSLAHEESKEYQRLIQLANKAAEEAKLESMASRNALQKALSQLELDSKAKVKAEKERTEAEAEAEAERESSEKARQKAVVQQELQAKAKSKAEKERDAADAERESSEKAMRKAVSQQDIDAKARARAEKERDEAEAELEKLRHQLDGARNTAKLLEGASHARIAELEDAKEQVNEFAERLGEASPYDVMALRSTTRRGSASSILTHSPHDNYNLRHTVSEYNTQQNVPAPHSTTTSTITRRSSKDHPAVTITVPEAASPPRSVTTHTEDPYSVTTKTRNRTVKKMPGRPAAAKRAAAHGAHDAAAEYVAKAMHVVHHD